MTQSGIAGLARRARLRAIAAGDAGMVARQEQAITQALATQAACDAAEQAERDNAQAMRHLGELGGLTPLPTFEYEVMIGTALFRVAAADEETAIWLARGDARDAGVPRYGAATAAVIQL